MEFPDREQGREYFDFIVNATGVKDVWPLQDYVRKNPPIFKFDYDIAYTLLAMLVMAEFKYAYPVYINKHGIGDVFGVNKKNIDDYMDWLTKVGLVRKYR